MEDLSKLTNYFCFLQLKEIEDRLIRAKKQVLRAKTDMGDPSLHLLMPYYSLLICAMGRRG